MNNLPKRKSIKSKILGILFFSIFVITAALGYLSFTFSKSRLVSMISSASKGIAATTAMFIEGGDIELIQENIEGIKEKYMAATSAAFSDVYRRSGEKGKYENSKVALALEKYLKYMEFLSNVKEANKIKSPINIYVRDGNYQKLILTSDSITLSGGRYSMRPEAERAFTENTPQATNVYKDKDGVWISAFAPIFYPSSSKNHAIIAINNKIDIYIDRLNRELSIIFFTCFILLIFTAIFSYQLINRPISAIKKLDEVATELEREKYGVKIDIDSQDEIGHLGRTFEKLRLSIKKKIDELRLSLVKEKRAHLESIIALTNAIALRDPYTSKHLYRVERYALLIAKAMRLPRPEIDKLRYGCYLHDIGKIYMEDELFIKTDLSKIEAEEIKKHAEKGSQIIEGIPFLREVKDIILYHQERYDGKGYPKGLKGEEIPLLARIVTVADAFDAMTSDRPYQKKMPFAKAMDIIRDNSGTQFDPNVCEAFLKYKGKIEKIAKKHF